EFVRRSLERRSGWTPEGAFLDAFGEREVLVGDAAGAVCLELDPYFGPRDGEVRMVIRGLGDVADRVHEHERGGPAVGFVLAANPSVLVVPAGEVAQLLGDLIIGVRVFLGNHVVLLAG